MAHTMFGRFGMWGTALLPFMVGIVPDLCIVLRQEECHIEELDLALWQYVTRPALDIAVVEHRMIGYTIVRPANASICMTSRPSTTAKDA